MMLKTTISLMFNVGLFTFAQCLRFMQFLQTDSNYAAFN